MPVLGPCSHDKTDDPHRNAPSNQRLTQGRAAAEGRPDLSLFVIFLVFLELGFFVEKQILDHPTLRRVCNDFEHCFVVFNVLPYDKKFHKRPPKTAPKLGLS
jgi:hypothetical protein